MRCVTGISRFLLESAARNDHVIDTFLADDSVFRLFAGMLGPRSAFDGRDFPESYLTRPPLVFASFHGPRARFKDYL